MTMPGRPHRQLVLHVAPLQPVVVWHGLAEVLLRAETTAEVASGLLESLVTTHGFPRAAVLLGLSGRLKVLASHGAAAPDAADAAGASTAVDRSQALGASVEVTSLVRSQEAWLAGLVPAGARLWLLPVGSGLRQPVTLVLQVPDALRGDWSREVLAQVERAAAQAGLALHRAAQLGQLRRLAATDDLTMIANRRSFRLSLDRELARSARSGEPLSLVMLDIDLFKRVNDAFGHPAGDDALRNVAASLVVACRDLDTPARYGGEEFAVILPDCGADQGVATADRLRAAIAAAPAVTGLTASAGVATCPDHARDADALVAAADSALLMAKARGRNTTVQASRWAPEVGEPRRS